MTFTTRFIDGQSRLELGNISSTSIPLPTPRVGDGVLFAGKDGETHRGTVREIVFRYPVPGTSYSMEVEIFLGEVMIWRTVA
jgi:hypothetical protein